MDNHPIPQDVTGFQFKLIGNMTIKQFIYVLVCGVLSVIFFYAPILWLIKFPLIFILLGVGIALAFVPYQGRPLDSMLTYFFKALMSPNQFVYYKTGGRLSFNHLPPHPTQAANTSRHETKQQAQDHANKLAAYLRSLPHDEKSPLDTKELTYINTILNAPPLALHTASHHTSVLDSGTPLAVGFAPAPQLHTQQQVEIQVQTHQQPVPTVKQDLWKPLPPLPSGTDEKHAVEKPVHSSTTAVIKKVEENAPKDMKHLLTKPEEKKEEKLTETLQAAVTERQAVQQAVEKAPQQQQPAAIRPTLDNQFVRNIPKPRAVSAGLPTVSDFPNIIVGIVKDSRGNVLPNILVEIQDKEGNPVRALKTNMLGQFATATQLQNGEYTITLEDLRGQHTFERIATSANGKIIEPIEIISHDAREELRKALFN